MGRAVNLPSTEGDSHGLRASNATRGSSSGSVILARAGGHAPRLKETPYLWMCVQVGMVGDTVGWFKTQAGAMRAVPRLLRDKNTLDVYVGRVMQRFKPK